MPQCTCKNCKAWQTDNDGTWQCHRHHRQQVHKLTGLRPESQVHCCNIALSRLVHANRQLVGAKVLDYIKAHQTGSSTPVMDALRALHPSWWQTLSHFEVLVMRAQEPHELASIALPARTHHLHKRLDCRKQRAQARQTLSD